MLQIGAFLYLGLAAVVLVRVPIPTAPVAVAQR